MEILAALAALDGGEGVGCFGVVRRRGESLLEGRGLITLERVLLLLMMQGGQGSSMDGNGGTWHL